LLHHVCKRNSIIALIKTDFINRRLSNCNNK